MQVMPSSGGWTNPAALSQQVLNDAKHAGATSHRSTNPEAVDKLEHAEKTSDRDANEKYDGPLGQNSPESSANDSNEDNNRADTMLSLPAIEETPSTLDLMG